MLQFRHTFLILALSTMLSLGCGTSGKDSSATRDSASVTSDSLQPTAIQPTETFNKEDVVENSYLADELQPVRDNFKRINSISAWTSVVEKELPETAEGGEAKYYYLAGRLEKIVTRQFGETFQQLTEYYLLNGQLSFVFEKMYKYNRPIYYDSTVMKDNNDTAAFDFEKSEITETRSYFKDEKMIHQIGNPDRSSPLSDDYLADEQKRIKADFKKLNNLAGGNKR